ncbi:MAG: FAD-binding oxidoreductase [Actinomycetota bacterium]|nr:FAD-binding oxidoreductase [Nocardioidaceae bacterium]MDQ3591796.1 FAD-binding oxidoreductase [Actinomycetota bacterium]
MSPTDADAVIIGAGVIGASIGYELSRRGWRTLNVDALPAAGYGSTSSSSAIVRFSYSTYTGVAMAWEGMHYWADWAGHLGADDERGLARFVQNGMVLLKEPGGHHERCVPLFDQVGIPYEDWDAAELARQLPTFDTGSFGPPTTADNDAFWADAQRQLDGGIWTPDAGYVNDPQLAAHNLQRAAEACGARFRFSTSVTAIERRQGRVSGVQLSDGSVVDTRVVVNVAGPHSGAINALAGLAGSMRIGTRALRHEVHHVPAPANTTADRTTQVADGDTGIYLRPEVGGTLVVGSLDPACDTQQEWVEDPDNFNRAVTATGFERQVLRAARRLPDLAVPNRPLGLAALYDVADDWIPVYDRTDLHGFYVAIGTSGNQFKNAGVAGHCMAELIGAVEGGQDHDAEPVVVTGRYTGLPVDLGVFRRNRVVHADSSFSVHG